jgi:hypothetical protein
VVPYGIQTLKPICLAEAGKVEEMLGKGGVIGRIALVCKPSLLR